MVTVGVSCSLSVASSLPNQVPDWRLGSVCKK